MGQGVGERPPLVVGARSEHAYLNRSMPEPYDSDANMEENDDETKRRYVDNGVPPRSWNHRRAAIPYLGHPAGSRRRTCPLPRVVPIKEVQKLTGMTVQAVRRHARKGVLVRVPAGAERAIGYTEASVRAFVEGRHHAAPVPSRGDRVHDCTRMKPKNREKQRNVANTPKKQNRLFPKDFIGFPGVFA